MKKKRFFLAGEASGDAIAAWYVQRHCSQGDGAYGVCGPLMRNAGVSSVMDISELSAVGVVEIVRLLPRLIRAFLFLKKHIVNGSYDEVVLIDFPGFNMRMARALKRVAPHIQITYVSPPQMWVWGAWRARSLAKSVDGIVVMYPFEVAWYKSRGIAAQFLSSPVLDRLHDEGLGSHVRNVDGKTILLMPGSRRQEIDSLMPLYAEVLSAVYERHPHINVAVSVAPSLSREYVQRAVEKYMPQVPVHYVVSRDEWWTVVRSAVCALTKPGTNTLELVLCGVASVVVYKTSWLTYTIARMLVSVTSMTLPNLLTRRAHVSEYIQGDCQPLVVAREIVRIHDLFQATPQQYYAECKAASDDVQSSLSAPTLDRKI